MSNFQRYVGTDGKKVYPQYDLTVVNGDVIDFGTSAVPVDGRWVSSSGPATHGPDNADVVAPSPLVDIPTTVVVVAADSPSRSGASVVCNGVSDGATISAAIAAAPSRGAKILLRVGTYVVDDQPIVIDRDHIDLEGEIHPMWGGYTQPYGGTSTPAGTVATACAKITTTVSGRNLIELQNVNDSGTGVDTYRHRGIRIAKLYLVGSSYTGLGVQSNFGRSPGAGFDACVFENLMVQKTLDGLGLWMDSAIVRGCDIQDIAGDAINYAGNFGQITGNLIFDIGGRGIVTNADGIVVSGNTVGNTPAAKVGIVHSQRAVTVGNTVEAGVAHTVYAISAAGGTVVGNVVMGSWNNAGTKTINGTAGTAISGNSGDVQP